MNLTHALPIRAFSGLLVSAALLTVGGCSSSTSPTTPETDSGTPVGDTGTPTCSGTPATHDVQVGGSTFTFTPATLTICAGDTVHWVWMGTGHDVESGTNGTADNKFCSGTSPTDPGDTNCAMAPLQNAGFTYDHVFTTAGSFPYFCRPHASIGMVGTITVQ
jgi:plastocyanin